MKTLTFLAPFLLFLPLLQARVIPERSDTSAVAEFEPGDAVNNYLSKRAPPEGTKIPIKTDHWEDAAENWCWYLLCVTTNQTWTLDPAGSNTRRSIDGTKLQPWTDPLKHGLPADQLDSTTADECPPASVVQSGGGINVGALPGQSTNFANFATLFRRPSRENPVQGSALLNAVTAAGVGEVDWNKGPQRNNQFYLDFSKSTANDKYWCKALSEGDTSKFKNPPPGNDPSKAGVHRTSPWKQAGGKKATFESTKSRFT